MLDAAEPMLLDARADPAPDPCAKTQGLGLCPNTRMALLTFHKCPGTGNVVSEGVDLPPVDGGAGAIQT